MSKKEEEGKKIPEWSIFDRIDELCLVERTYNFSDEFIKEMYQSAEPRILEKIKDYDLNH